MKNYFGLFVVMVILCGCAGLVSCKHEPESKSIDLGDSALEAAYRDYRRAVLHGDEEALSRIFAETTEPKGLSDVRCDFATGNLIVAITAEAINTPGYREWMESAYVVRREVSDDGDRVVLWLGPETDKRFRTVLIPIGSASDTGTADPNYIQVGGECFHERPIVFCKREGRWVLWIG